MTNSNLAVERFMGIEDPAVGARYIRRVLLNGSGDSESYSFELRGREFIVPDDATKQELEEVLLRHYSEQAVNKVLALPIASIRACPDYAGRILKQGR